jgi:hypothetical protein
MIKTIYCAFSAFVLSSTAQTLIDPQADIDRQVPEAMNFLKVWEEDQPEKASRYLHIVYWTPADREPAEAYAPRLQRMLEHIQAFYAREMTRLGFGPRTIQLQKDAGDKLIIHLVTGAGPYADYNVQSGNKIKQECLPALKKAGVDVDNETIVIFCNMADWDAEKRVLRHRSPYYAGGDFQRGTAWQLDSPILDTLNLEKKEPKMHDGQYGHISIGKHNSIFIGGIAHELGHSLGLPHDKERSDERALFGTALMGSCNRSYGDELRGEGKGSFLTLAHGLRLASHPQFSGSVKQLKTRAKAKLLEPTIRADGKGFVFTGKMDGELPIYAVVAYMDPEGGGDYNATTTSAIPDADGRFVLNCQALAPGKVGELRLVACFVNGAGSGNVGAWSPFKFPYTVKRDGTPEITTLSQRLCLTPLIDAVNRNDRDEMKKGIAFLRAHATDEASKEMATRLMQSVNPSFKAVPPDQVPMTTKTAALSDLEPSSEKVGWLTPTRGRVPDPQALFESAGRLYPSGIYAHAPARHTFPLGGKWKTLRGKAGVYDSRNGSVVFVIKADGKDLYRSELTRSGKICDYAVSLDGVKELELLVEGGGDGFGSDWGLWLEPELSR